MAFSRVFLPATTPGDDESHCQAWMVYLNGLPRTAWGVSAEFVQDGLMNPNMGKITAASHWLTWIWGTHSGVKLGTWSEPRLSLYSEPQKWWSSRSGPLNWYDG